MPTVPSAQTVRPITILSGPVGAGKSTVAQALIQIAKTPFTYIEGDIFWSFIVKQHDQLEFHGNFRMIMRAMLSAASHYAIHGYDTLVDFSIPPWFLQTAIAVAKFREIPLNYVVIRPSEPICIERAKVRKEGRILDYTQYHDLYRSFDEATQLYNSKRYKHSRSSCKGNLQSISIG